MLSAVQLDALDPFFTISEAAHLEWFDVLMEGRYDHIDFTPPEEVRKAAAKGLRWREKYGRGGTPIGIGRAHDLSKGRKISPDIIVRMVAFFDRHHKNRNNHPDSGRNGMIAWLLWGGNPGRKWAEKILSQMKKANPKLESMMLDTMKRTLALNESLLVDDGVESVLEVLEYLGIDAANPGQAYMIAASAALAAGQGRRSDRVTIRISDYKIDIDQLRSMDTQDAAKDLAVILRYGFINDLCRRLMGPVLKSNIDYSLKNVSENMRGAFPLLVRDLERVMSSDDEYNEDYLSSGENYGFFLFARMISSMVDAEVNAYRIKALKRNRFDLPMVDNYVLGHSYVGQHFEVTHGGRLAAVAEHLYDAVSGMFFEILDESIELTFRELGIESEVVIQRVDMIDPIVISGPGGRYTVRNPRMQNGLDFALRVPPSSVLRIGAEQPRKVKKPKFIDEENFQLRIMPSMRDAATEKAREMFAKHAIKQGLPKKAVKRLVPLLQGRKP